MSLAAHIVDTNGKYKEYRRYCWFDTSISGHEVSDFVKYEFTPIGHVRAAFSFLRRHRFVVSRCATSNLECLLSRIRVCRLRPAEEGKDKYLKQDEAFLE
jgi:hypothetical protein